MGYSITLVIESKSMYWKETDTSNYSFVNVNGGKGIIQAHKFFTELPVAFFRKSEKSWNVPAKHKIYFPPKVIQIIQISVNSRHISNCFAESSVIRSVSEVKAFCIVSEYL